MKKTNRSVIPGFGLTTGITLAILSVVVLIPLASLVVFSAQMSLDEMSELGLSYDEDITISSMCSVFAESEVVSLVAQNKKKDDIVHGINKAVALKTLALVKRVSGESRYMMTGGVAKNKGLVATLSEMLKEELSISENAQLCGALGAALFAMGE